LFSFTVAAPPTGLFTQAVISCARSVRPSEFFGLFGELSEAQSQTLFSNGGRLPVWIDYQLGNEDAKAFARNAGRLHTTKPRGSIPSGQVDRNPKLTHPALTDDLGQMIVVIEHNPAAKAATPGRDRIETWIQRTNIGLDAFVDAPI